MVVNSEGISVFVFSYRRGEEGKGVGMSCCVWFLGMRMLGVSVCVLPSLNVSIFEFLRALS